MDTKWPNEALSCAAQFDGLYDELLSFDLPARKAESQVAGQELSPVTVQQVQAAEMNRKRKLELAEKESLETFLAQLGTEEAAGAGSTEPDLDVGMKRKGSDEKEAKLDTARNKACRERARRERLNDRCRSSRCVFDSKLCIMSVLAGTKLPPGGSCVEYIASSAVSPSFQRL